MHWPCTPSWGKWALSIMEDLLLYMGATLALRYVRLGLLGRPERRLQRQVSQSSQKLFFVTVCYQP